MNKIKNLLKLNKKLFIVITSLIIIGILLIAYILTLRKFVENLEIYSYDFRVNIAYNIYNKYIEPDKDLIALIFNDSDAQFFSEKHNEFGFSKWPLPRRDIGKINDFLIRSNARLIMYDIIFSGQTNEYDDNYFARSIKKAGNVYLASLPQLCSYKIVNIIKNDTINDLNKSKLSEYNKFKFILNFYLNSYAKKFELKNSNKSLAKKLFRTVKINTSDYSEKLLANISLLDTNLPHSTFLNHAKSTGLILTGNDFSGVLRKFPIIGLLDNKLYPNLALAAYLEMLPPEENNIEIKGNQLIIGEKSIPLDDEGSFYVNWKSATYYKNQVNFHSVYLYEKYYTLNHNTGYITLPEEENYLMSSQYKYLLNYSKIIDNKLLALRTYGYLYHFKPNHDNDLCKKLKQFKPNSSIKSIYYTNSNYLRAPFYMLEKYNKQLIAPFNFTNKVVFIAEATATGDVHKNPLGLYPGCISFIAMLDNFLSDDNFIHKSSLWLNILIYLCLIGFSLLSIKLFSNNVASILSFLIFYSAYFILSVAVFILFKLWIPLVEPFLIVSLFFVFALITQNLLTKDQLKKTYKLATTDGLTGLYNHRYFQEKISNKIDEVKRKEDSFSIMLIDIDFFKKFNDTYGHRAGDAVLIQVGQVLKNSVRGNDIVCRYGGEEMCIILDKTSTDEAIEVANKIIKTIAETKFFIEEGKKIVNVTISAGIANYSEHGNTIAGLIEFADQGLYRAKEGGRNRLGEMEDILEVSDQPVISKEIEISKAKISKEVENIISVCEEKGFDSNTILNNLLKDYQKKETEE